MKVISVGMFVDGNVPVVWRGPMLPRALQQFLADVYWGDLDVLPVVETVPLTVVPQPELPEASTARTR